MLPDMPESIPPCTDGSASGGGLDAQVCPAQELSVDRDDDGAQRHEQRAHRRRQDEPDRGQNARRQWQRDHVVARRPDQILDHLTIGSGTDVAIESAGIILVQSNPLDVVKIIELSRASYRKMVENLLWASGYNIIALPLAAGVLAPWGINISPAFGALLMSLSTIIVAFNAQLLRSTSLAE